MEHGDGPGFGAMIGLVAVVVATVILVFFGIGYLLGNCSCEPRRGAAAHPVRCCRPVPAARLSSL